MCRRGAGNGIDAGAYLKRTKYRKRIHHIRTSLTAILPIIFLISTYVKIGVLSSLAATVMAVVFILNIPKATGSSRILGYALVIVSGGVIILNGNNIEDWRLGIENNIDLISLFLTVPFLSVPLKYGGYLESVEMLFRKKVKKNYQVYGFSMFAAFVLGAVFNLASLHIIYQLFCQSGSPERKDLVLLAAVRGFTACIFWSPTFFSIGMILTMTGNRWIDIVPYGFTLSLVMLAIGFIIDFVDKKRKSAPEVMDIQGYERDENYHVNQRKLGELFLIGGTILIAAVVLNTFLNLSILILVPTLAIIFPLLWLWYLGRIPLLPNILKVYYNYELPRHANEIVLFTGIGLLGIAIKTSEIGFYLVYALEKIIGLDPFLSLMIISFLIALLFIIGISPIVTVTVITASLPQLSVDWEPLFLATGLIAGWAIGIVLSPFAALNLMVGVLNNKSPVEISLKNNWLYAVIALPVIWSLIAVFFR